ncbi:MAG: hypothetical protein EZS28_003470 [Streblomastix strix]|uniref:Uncharacterized protein n=1 Tax=Streblomastix strix TaxID=222440 RepID=A0A5J4X1Y9_9EUKA|nr:MAG: hypothetical protein EZS28_003470 [Streblomastix strix]
MSEKEQQSSSSQEQGPSAYYKNSKALLVLTFMSKPEIEAFLADQGFDPPIFDKDNPRFIEKLNALKQYMLSKQMAFEDQTQRFPMMNNSLSKTETQQKMTYAQVANSWEEQHRFYMLHCPKAWFIANSKLGQPAALLSGPSAPPSIEKEAQMNRKIPLGVLEQHQQHKIQQISQDTIKEAQVQEIQQIILHFNDGEFRKDKAKIVGVHRPSQFDPKKMELRDSWRKSVEQNRCRYENLWSTSEPAEIQPNESSHVYADCSRAVQLEESALIAEIHRIIPDQPPSIYLIDAYLMFLTAGIKHRATIDWPQLRPHPYMRTFRITEGSTTTEKEGTDNRAMINMRIVARDAQSRILND